MTAPFPDTQWSELVALKDGDHPRRRELLQSLAEKYWTPIYHYVRSLRRISAQDAQDHTQQFFSRLLEPGWLAGVDADRGSFRSFLKTSLRNFLVDTDRAARARPFDFSYGDAEAAWQEQPDLSPDQAFDRAWGRAVLSETLDRLRVELQSTGAASGQLAVLEDYTREPASTYRERAARLGVSEDDVRNRLREARHRLRQTARTLLREYLGPEEDVEQELRHILGK